MSEKEHDDIKEAVSMTLPGPVADLASIRVIGQRITESTQNSDPDSSVTGTISRAGIITHAIRQVGHLFLTPPGPCVLTVRAGH